MIIDICIALFLVICIFIGDKRGFVLSFVNTFGWLFSLGSSFLFRDRFAEYLETHTSMHSDITMKVTEFIRFRMQHAASEAAAGSDAASSAASALQNASAGVLQLAAEKAASPIADAVFSIIAFLFLMLAIRVVMYIIEAVIKIFIGGDTPIGSMDSILGMFFSLIKGVIIAYVILMGMFVTSVIGNIDPLLEQVESSFVFTTMNNAGLVPDVFSEFSIEI